MLAPSVATINTLLMLGNEPSWRPYAMTRRTGAKSNTVTISALRTLERTGVVRQLEHGGHREYAPATDNPYYEAARRMALVDLGLGKLLPTDARVLAIFIHGSLAEGKATPDSDVDVFVVGKADPKAISRAFRPVELLLGRMLDVTVMTSAQVHEAIRSNDTFVKGAVENGVCVWGTWG